MSEKALLIKTPTPSNTPSKIPQPTAPPNAAFGPPKISSLNK